MNRREFIAAAIWIAFPSPVISWWRQFPAGFTSRPVTCSTLSNYSPVRITIAMCASGTAITARSVRSSCRTCSGAVVRIAARYSRRVHEQSAVEEPVPVSFWA
jgi:hypothetical protein